MPAASFGFGVWVYGSAAAAGWFTAIRDRTGDLILDRSGNMLFLRT